MLAREHRRLPLDRLRHVLGQLELKRHVGRIANVPAHLVLAPSERCAGSRRWTSICPGRTDSSTLTRPTSRSAAS